MSDRIRCSLLCFGLAVVVGSGCGEGGPMNEPESWEIQVISGGSQIGLPGAPLPEPVVVEVRSAGTGLPGSGLLVRFDGIEGVGLRLDPTEALTDGSGRARVQVRLGTVSGTYRLGVRVADGATATTADALAVAVPELLALSAAVITAGESLALAGSSLWSAAGGRVEFGGVRGAVLASTPDRLDVEVPTCLPTGPVPVQVFGPTGASALLPIQVQASGPGTHLMPGQDLVIEATGPRACQRVVLAPGEEMLVLALSASAEVAGPASMEMRGVALPQAITGPNASRGRPERAPPAPGRLERIQAASGALRERLDVLTAATEPTDAPARAQGRVPAVGEMRSFEVLLPSGTFATVEAEARYVSERAAFFVEEGSLALPVGDPVWAELGVLFDEPIWEVDTAEFGRVPDLDGNQRVALLFTSAVNGLSAPGGGRVGGFFFPVDLLPNRTGSNAGEVLYLILPDPEGAYGEPVTKAEIAAAIPAVIAHELQHLIHFNERMLVLGAADNEATWLSEALAVMAEDRVAAHLESQGDLAGRDRFQRGNLVRAREYLAGPQDVSLIITQGAGTVAERGGSWLFLRYLSERFGFGLLGRLTRSTQRGVLNIEAATGGGWAGRLGDWGVALEADGLPGMPTQFTYPTLDLAGAIGGPAHPVPPLVGSLPRARLTLRPSSLAHLVLSGDEIGEVALTLAGDTEGMPPAAANIELRLVRLR